MSRSLREFKLFEIIGTDERFQQSKLQRKSKWGEFPPKKIKWAIIYIEPYADVQMKKTNKLHKFGQFSCDAPYFYGPTLFNGTGNIVICERNVDIAYELVNAWRYFLSAILMHSETIVIARRVNIEFVCIHSKINLRVFILSFPQIVLTVCSVCISISYFPNTVLCCVCMPYWLLPLL